MGQLGLFDVRRRYEGLDAKNDLLVSIAAMFHGSLSGQI